MFSSFHEAVSYVFSSYVQSKPFRVAGLDKVTRNPAHMRHLLELVGSPDRLQRNIKVTGSKGKGSTSRLIAGILQSQGYRVGLFTSPHLVDFTERIRVNGLAIEEDDFVRILSSIRDHVDRLLSQLKPSEYIGPVGLTAIVACLYFLEQKTDVNVIELGRGARSDDVNVLAGEIAVLTPVHLEHADYLGPTLSDIAHSKSGIITPDLRQVVIGKQSKEVLQILRQEARLLGVAHRMFGEDFSLNDIELDESGSVCTISTPRAGYSGLRLGMLGRNQVENLSVALTAAEDFMDKSCTKRPLRDVLATMRFPGRCQVIPDRPLVLVDGAINRETAEYLREVALRLDRSTIVSIIGIPEDKDYAGVFEVLGSISLRIIVTEAQNPHLSFAKGATECASAWCPATFCDSLTSAIHTAQGFCEEEGLLIIAGTQSLVAEALSYFCVPTRHLE